MAEIREQFRRTVIHEERLADDTALSNAVLNTVNRLLLEHDAEGLLHVGGCAGKPDGAACKRGGIRFDLQVELASEGADERYSGGVGGVLFLNTRRG